MNLIIDVGNSRVKLAVYSDKGLICKKIVSVENLINSSNSLLSQYPSIDAAIVSSVGKIKPKELKWLQKKLEVIILSHKTKIPFKNKYSTPTTLGVDRMALVSASVEKYPDKNVLIIDAGTCITYDFITSDNIYLGGAISPGIRTRYRSLNNLTSNLPLLETKTPRNIIGRSTAGSIHSGIIFGIEKEIDGVIEEYQKNYRDLTVILTGGDVKLLSKRLKSSIFANSNFLLEGLNYILEFNKK
mgnify:CR=1 FL=1